MTREEARNRIDAIIARHEMDDDYVTITSILDYDAFRMARKALEQEPSGDLISRDELLKAIDTWDKFGVDDTNSLFRLDNLSLPHYVPYIHYDDVVKCIKGMPSVNPQPCDDLISRQAVLNACEQSINILEAVDRIMDLPSVEQEPKTGYWSHDGSHWKNRFICSECGYKLFDEPTNYCPNCGCRMVEPQESEDKQTEKSCDNCCMQHKCAGFIYGNYWCWRPWPQESEE